jgi:hypothetical protein
MDHIRLPPTDGLTNQCVHNVENAKKTYEALNMHLTNYNKK